MSEVSVFVAAFIPVPTPEGSLGWGYVLQETGGKRFLPLLTNAEQILMIDAAICTEMRPGGNKIGKIEKVVVKDLRGEDYYSLLYTNLPSGELEVTELRPSDAIAFALEEKTPIFVEERLFENYEANATESNKQSIGVILDLCGGN